MLCPHCGYTNDAVTNFSGRTTPPKDGDFSICIDCAEPSVFVVGAAFTSMRALTPEESAEFADKHHRMARVMREFVAERRDQK